MMQHKPTSGWMRLAYAALLPFLAGTMFLCNPARAEIRPATPGSSDIAAPDSTDKAAVPYSLLEKHPTFQGQDAGAFSLWVAQHLSYPAEAKEAGIQGRVMVGFEICEDGSVRNAKVLRGVHPLLDAEAVRVLSASPKWEPGYQDGKPVKVSFNFPVIFKLNGEDSAPSVITIRKADGAGDPLIYLDGEKYTGNLGDIDASTIESMEVLKDEAAVRKYGDEAKNGVILIKTKQK